MATLHEDKYKLYAIPPTTNPFHNAWMWDGGNYGRIGAKELASRLNGNGWKPRPDLALKIAPTDMWVTLAHCLDSTVGKSGCGKCSIDKKRR